MGLYEILKASKLGAGAAPDMYTALFAQKISGGEAELSGVPPLTFRSNGTPLLDYLISGNKQSGTPTPDNLVTLEGCGERTGNLVEVSNSNCIIYSTYNQLTITNNIINITGNSLFGFIAKCNSNAEYTVSCIRTGYNVDMRIREYSDLPTDWTTDFITQSVNQPSSAGNSATFTTTATTKYLLVCFYGSNIARISNIMLNTGSTALSYEPYGYKIPIICGGTITAVYIGTNPLRKSLDGTAVDELSSNGTLTQRVDTDGSVLPTPIISQIDTPTIPTTDGSNTFDVDTTVKPSEVYIKYRT